MFASAERFGELRGALQFDAVPLAVVEGEREALATFGPRPGQDGGGIETAGEEDDSFFHNYVTS